MADVYIVYAREDHGLAQKLHKLLSQQWDTWCDEDLVGNVSKGIEIEISKCGCMVILLSEKSRGKDAVIDELRIGKENKKTFIPIRLDDSSAPYLYGGDSGIDMQNWNGEDEHRGLELLCKKISAIVPPKKSLPRPSSINDKVLLPTFFRSVSSFETRLTPVDAVTVLRLSKAPTILVSAYDLFHSKESNKFIDELQKYRNAGGFIIIDSGNYEKYRLRDDKWDEPFLEYILCSAPHDWSFCFDIMNPNSDRDLAVSEILDAVARGQKYSKMPVLPIVHAPRLSSNGHDLEHIPYIIREVSDKLKPPLIAIPERELGAGLIPLTKAVQSIRKELQKLPRYQPLHILGTGNPWTLSVLAAAGADSFDGLEWCRMAVDREEDKLHHFQHFDIFDYQISQSESSIVKEAFYNKEINFAGKVCLHNIDYYAVLEKDMRDSFSGNKIDSFLARILRKEAFDLLKKRCPDLLK